MLGMADSRFITFLRFFLGPADHSEFGPEHDTHRDFTCPHCGQPFSTHEVVREGGKAFTTCPRPAEVA